MPTNENTIRKINKNNSVTGNCYLTNDNSITVGGHTYTINNGFDFADVSQDVQEAAKYKKTFAVANPATEIPFVKLDDSITLIENYNEAHRYAYDTPHEYSGYDGSQHILSLPKRLVRWNYRSNNTLVAVPERFTQEFAANFVNGNLDVYAEWNDDIKAIRVIPYLMSAALTSMTPSCTVSITSTSSYTGNNPLSINYSKMLHRKTSDSDTIDWANCKDDIGTNTGPGIAGNGCRMADPDNQNKMVPCYYGIKSGDSITLTLSGLNGTHPGGTCQNAYKPFSLTSNPYSPKYKVAEKLSANINDSTPQYTNYNSSSQGTYIISRNNVTSDLTFILPLVLNTYSITVRCEDADPSTASTKGTVNVTSLNYNGGPNTYPITANCVNGETVTISVSPQTGYIFSRWADGDGVTVGTNPTFTLPIDSTVDENIYVAYFTTGQFTLTYHKEEDNQ